MVAIWQYVAGHSFVFPIVRKKRDIRLNTSANVVSSLFLWGCCSSRTSFRRVTWQEFMNTGFRRYVRNYTLFHNGLIDRKHIMGFDILPPVFLKDCEAVTNAGERCRSWLGKSIRNKTFSLTHFITASRMGSSNEQIWLERSYTKWKGSIDCLPSWGTDMEQDGKGFA